MNDEMKQLLKDTEELIELELLRVQVQNTLDNTFNKCIVKEELV